MVAVRARGVVAVSVLATVLWCSSVNAQEPEGRSRGDPLTRAVARPLPAGEVAALFREALGLHARGDYESAAAIWSGIAGSPDVDDVWRARSAIAHADATRQMGLYSEGLSQLQAARSLVERSGDAALAVQFAQVLGNLQLASHRHEEAIATLDAAAMRTNDGRLLASVLNDLGNALRVDGRLSDALGAYRRALRLATEHELATLRANAAINALRLLMRMQRIDEARVTLHELSEALAAAQPSAERAYALIGASEIEMALGQSIEAARRDTWLAQADEYARATNNGRLMSLAAGRRGMDLATSDVAAAEHRLREAAFFAAQERAGELSYFWHWQLARLYMRASRRDEALAEFAAALAALAPLRAELMNGYHDTDEHFETDIRPLYVEYVDALLRGSASADATTRAAALMRARATLEQLKSAELQDYFRDECVLAQEAQARPVETIDADAAVLYPIVLPDRIELLVQIHGTLIQETVPIERERVTESALRLRELIQAPDNTRFLPYARRLHRWLIEPIMPALQRARVQTLVIVPDGALRVIPFAVLHDGSDYLVRSFALATTPSLTLTAPRPLAQGNRPALLTGISAPVQGFASLPEVKNELASIRAQVGGEVLIDASYTAAGFAAALEREQYAIVHMATHSVVSESSANSFLLTYDGRLTMSDLERILRRGRFREQPIELLTLSACETAIGDERAALGLAGIALKAGARSALATLWRVDDAAAAALTSAFYAALAAPEPHSKAQALRAAQLRVLEQDATAHPAHWAAFMLIGNWL